MRKTWIVMLSLIISVLVLAACGGDNEAEQSSGEDVEFDIPEADLEGIPDTVAEINGEKITKEEFEMNFQQYFQQMAMQAQMTGEEIDQDAIKEQVADGMISQVLLTQEADKRVKDVSEEDVNKTLDELVEQNGLETKEEFFEAFVDQGMDEAKVMSLIEKQVKVDALIAEETGDIEPTDKELKELYATIQEQQKQMETEEELPSFEELKEDLAKQVKSKKETEIVQTLVDKLREKGDITVHL